MISYRQSVIITAVVVLPLATVVPLLCYNLHPDLRPTLFAGQEFIAQSQGLPIPDAAHNESLPFLPLLPWEENAIRNLENGSLVCNKPRVTPESCCPGFIMPGAPYKLCSHVDYERVGRLARQFVNQWPSSSCDMCRIMEILRQRDEKLTVLGDSVTLQTFEGLFCELLRRNYLVVRDTTFRPLFDEVEGSQIRSNQTISVTSPTWSQHEVVHIQLFFIYSPPFRISEDDAKQIYQTGGVIWFNFGLHGGHTNKLFHFQENMVHFFLTMKKNGTSSLLLFRETTAQHFDTPSGMYGMNDIDHRSTYCTALEWSNEVGSRDRAVQDAALEAGYEIVSPTEASPGKLVILPFHNFTAQLHDGHPYDNGEFNTSTQQADCTHYCLSPFLFVPLWRTFRIAMDAAYS